MGFQFKFLIAKRNDRAVKDADGWSRNLGVGKGSGISFLLPAAIITISLAHLGQALTFLNCFHKLNRELCTSATHNHAFFRA